MITRSSNGASNNPEYDSSFSSALIMLKQGKRVAREGWNGKNMSLFYNPGSRITVSEGRPLAAAIPVGTEVECLPYIMMVTVTGAIVPWLCSQTDMIAEDWFIVGD